MDVTTIYQPGSKRFLICSTHKRTNNTSGFTGVNVRKRKNGNVYSAIIGDKGKLIHLGTFKDITQAARAYNRSAVKYHGKLAQLNEI